MNSLTVKDLDMTTELDEQAAARIAGGKRYKFKGTVAPGVRFVQGVPLTEPVGVVTDIFGEDGDYTEEAAEYILSNPGAVIPLF